MLKLVLLLSAVALCGSAAVFTGAYKEVEMDDKGVLAVQAASQAAARALSQKFSSIYHHALVKVTKAEQQVVAGMNYRMDIVVGETIYKKEEVAYEELGLPEFQAGPTSYKKCQVVVFLDLVGKHHLTYSSCVAVSEKDI